MNYFSGDLPFGANVYALIKPFVNLCLLNSDPQDLPVSATLLWLTLSSYLLISIVLALPVYGLSMSILQALIEVGLLITYTSIVLQTTAHPERYTQTLSALAGTGVIFGLLALPLVYSIYSSASVDGTADILTLFAYLLILAWLLVVYGHVFKHALSSGIFVGLLVGLGYILLTSLIIDTILPVPDLN